MNRWLAALAALSVSCDTPPVDVGGTTCAVNDHPAPPPDCTAPVPVDTGGEGSLPATAVAVDGQCVQVESLCHRCLALGGFRWDQCPSFDELADAVACRGTAVAGYSGTGSCGGQQWINTNQGGQDGYFESAIFDDAGTLVSISRWDGLGVTSACCAGTCQTGQIWGAPLTGCQ